MSESPKHYTMFRMCLRCNQFSLIRENNSFGIEKVFMI